MNFETLHFLAEFSFLNGLIGFAEFRERIEVARWLSFEEDAPDPRKPRTRKVVTDPELSEQADLDEMEQEDEDGFNNPKNDSGPAVLELKILNHWCFTIGDADCFPSVPHGHFLSETSAWPKLNPYTGRVFADIHREKGSMRLSKTEMRILWNDESFKAHCRKQIMWYMETHTNYVFPVRYPMRLPRW